MVAGKTGGLRSPLSSDEDECGDASGRLEKGVGGVLLLPLHLETIPLGIFTDLDQSNRLFSFSGDATPVYKKENPRRDAKVPWMKQCQMSRFKVQRNQMLKRVQHDMTVRLGLLSSGTCFGISVSGFRI